jgi:hypothetical protein
MQIVDADAGAGGAGAGAGADGRKEKKRGTQSNSVPRYVLCKCPK